MNQEEINDLADDAQRTADKMDEVALVTWDDDPHVVMAKDYEYRRHGVIERVRRPDGYEPPALGRW